MDLRISDHTHICTSSFPFRKLEVYLRKGKRFMKKAMISLLVLAAAVVVLPDGTQFNVMDMPTIQEMFGDSDVLYRHSQNPYF